MSGSAAHKARKVFDNRYEILSIVGRGHCSVVYHARHIMAPSSEVALKVLLEQKGQRSNAERLRREALAMVSARHRYVIRLDDFHSVGDLCYLSMEYAPESDLRKYADKNGGMLDPVQAETFLGQMLDAIGFLHKTGIIHRDIKPDNVLVIDDFEVRLGDFGVAVLPGTTSSLEELQRGVGTMDYMAPEVLEGTGYEIRSDIYALGVTFYEMLTGVHPFRDAPLMEQVTSRHDGKFKSLSEIAPDVPSHLANAITRAMSFKAEDRFASAKDFAKALSTTRAQGSLRERYEMEQESTPMSTTENTASMIPTEAITPPIEDTTGPRATRAAKRTRTRKKAARTETIEVAPIAEAAAVEATTIDTPITEAPATAPEAITAAPAEVAKPVEETVEVAKATEPDVAVQITETLEQPIEAASEPAPVAKEAPATTTSETDADKQLQAILDQISALEVGSTESPTSDEVSAQPLSATPPVATTTSLTPATTPEAAVPAVEKMEAKPTPTATVTSAMGSAAPATTSTPRVANEPTIAARVSRSKTMRIDREMVERIRAHNASVTAAVSATATTDASKLASPPALRSTEPTPGFTLPVRTKKLFFTSLTVALFLVMLVCVPIFLKYNHHIDVTETVAGPSTPVEVSAPPAPPTELTFPMLPSGIYSGTVTGLIPGRDTPLTILSFAKRKKLVFIVGVEGWNAASVALDQWEEKGGAADPMKPLRVASNGFLLELSGTSSDGVLIGNFVNLVTGEEGAWRASEASS